jgi:hypothetical protein
MPDSVFQNAIRKLFIMIGRYGGDEMVSTLRDLILQRLNSSNLDNTQEAFRMLAYLLWSLVIEFARDEDAIITEFKWLIGCQRMCDWGEIVWLLLPEGDNLPGWVVTLWRLFGKRVRFGPGREDAAFCKKVFKVVTEPEVKAWLNAKKVMGMDPSLTQLLFQMLDSCTFTKEDRDQTRSN